ncbi:MAG: DUF3040 domain-containing protein [Pseudolysinimonas sp.]|uniref:DUF3040 domain-containing protein n=1 Tax=Pseudolysinimonas sp. TaxID=2680009 RepID=UPI003262CCF9
MPLSEQEQRLLDEMERNLYHGDADDVTTVGRPGRANYTAIALGILGGVVGLILLVVGVIVRQPVVGLLGFLLMFGGALLCFAPPRRLTVPQDPRDAAGPPRAGFMDTLNERWERRNDTEE